MSRKKVSSLTPLKFPVNALPSGVKHFVETGATVYQSPVDFWAGAAIISTALAIGDKIELESRYKDVPILWMCIVGDVSTGKTQPLSLCLKPFEEKDNASIQIFQQENRAYMQSQRRHQGRQPDDNPTEPKCFQYILKDATPEAMAVVHSVNQRGILYYRDELAGFIDDFGRYNQSGEQSNLLSTYNRVAMKINRKSDSQVIYINDPCILIAGGMQPDLLPKLAKDNREDNGFLARMCFIYPDNAVKPEYSDAEMPQEQLSEFYAGLNRLMNIQEKIVIRLNDEAQQRYVGWYNHNANLTNHALNGYIKGVYGKLDIMCLRIAVVIAGMNYMYTERELNQNITLGEINSAIAITEYFRRTAVKVYDRIHKKPRIPKVVVANYLYHVAGITNKSELSRMLDTSRKEIDRGVNGTY